LIFARKTALGLLEEWPLLMNLAATLMFPSSSGNVCWPTFHTPYGLPHTDASLIGADLRSAELHEAASPAPFSICCRYMAFSSRDSIPGGGAMCAGAQTRPVASRKVVRSDCYR